VSDDLLFNLVRRLKRRWTGRPAGLTQAEVDEVNAVLKASREPRGAPIEAGGAIAPPTPGTALREAAGAAENVVTKKGPLAAIVGVVAATSLFASIPEHEGIEYKAYRDIAGIWTICAGDTNDVRAGLIETPEGCWQRLEKQLVAHAGPVMSCTPRLKEDGRDWQRAAAVSLAYNIGVGAWCRSTADRRFDAGDWKGGCNAFLSWNKARVGGVLREVRGLTRRRQEERTVCLRGIA
jgi:lysozyme